MLVSIEDCEGSSVDATGQRDRQLYCLKCARWTAHAHAGDHGPLGIWRCQRCGAPQMRRAAHEVEGQSSAAVGQAANTRTVCPWRTGQSGPE
ncbi:unnamed protein product [marine sediment metagenome]|uniref:Uncharacterized protein n=1 Tax=marine sediment metagenome TaxID=412755 RepID=X1TXM5_9ZZZZ